ncbi:MAG: serine hydrolase, partial [Acidobacteriota bacterium]
GAAHPTTEKRLITEQGWDPTLVPAWSLGQPDDGNARFLGGVAGNAGLFGTARGVRRLAAEYLPGGGSLLTADEARQATRLHTKGLAQGRGWGWQLGSTKGASSGPALSKEAFGHNGFTGVSVWSEPRNGGVFVLLTNRNHPSQRENDLHPLRRRFHSLAASDIAM